MNERQEFFHGVYQSCGFEVPVAAQVTDSSKVDLCARQQLIYH
jgi:hypothetical protein